MTINKIMQPMLASFVIGLAGSALAADVPAVEAPKVDTAESTSAALVTTTPKSMYDFGSGYYVGVKGGLVVPSNIQGDSNLQSVSPSTTYTVGVVLGKQLTERFAAEIEYSYRGKSNIKSSSTGENSTSYSDVWAVRSSTFMVNAIANLLEGQNMVMPYLKAGIGTSNNKSYDYVDTRINNNTQTQTWSGKSKSVFAWQAAFGLNLTTSKMVDTNFEYAYLNRGKFETQNNATVVTNGVAAPGGSVPDSAKTGTLKEQVITIGFKVKL